jgi:hypothetical protein
MCMTKTMPVTTASFAAHDSCQPMSMPMPQSCNVRPAAAAAAAAAQTRQCA